MRPSVPDVHITDSQDAEFATYRAFATQSVVGLIFGLLSPLSFLAHAFWFVPFVGVFFGGWALRRIKNNPEALTGRKLAWAGLSLSLLFAVAAPTDWLVYSHVVRNEARQVSLSWLQYLTHDEPLKSHQLTLSPDGRRPPDENLSDYYRNNPRSRKAIEGYIQSPRVRTMLALGPRAVVRFYDTVEQVHDENEDLVKMIFAVTYEDEGEKKSFFVYVQAYRKKRPDGRADWQIFPAGAGARPEDW